MYCLAGSYRLDCIAVSLDCCILLDLDRIGWIGWIGLAGLARLDHNGWMRKYSSCKDGTDGTDGMDGLDGMDGVLVGLGWYRRLLAPAGKEVTDQECQHWLAGYCKQGKNGTDGIDGALVAQGWDGQTLVGANTGASPWAPEQGRHPWLC